MLVFCCRYSLSAVVPEQRLQASGGNGTNGTGTTIGGGVGHSIFALPLAPRQGNYARYTRGDIATYSDS